MSKSTESMCWPALLRRGPDAFAQLRGSADCPALTGTVRFYQTRRGVFVAAEVRGLPEPSEPCGNRVFGFHIHSGSTCAGDSADPFAAAMGHYNPENCPHPAHAGDLPPLFSNHGEAVQVVLTDRVTVGELIGKTLIVHARPDDFNTQPAGNAGARIACGKIVAASCAR